MEIDLTKSVYEIVSLYPQVKEIMFEIGFKEIAQPGMLQTAGRYMTIPTGARMKKIPLEEIVAAFKANGFTVKGE